jgi:hypothetical protein
MKLKPLNLVRKKKINIIQLVRNKWSHTEDIVEWWSKNILALGIPL